MARKKMARGSHNADLYELAEIYPEAASSEAMMGMMQGLIGTTRHNTTVAFELTKLIVDQKTDTPMSSAEILKTFEQASKAVSDNSSLNELLEKMS